MGSQTWATQNLPSVVFWASVLLLSGLLLTGIFIFVHELVNRAPQFDLLPLNRLYLDVKIRQEHPFPIFWTIARFSNSCLTEIFKTIATVHFIASK